jgi:hypothetical protein
MEVATQRRANRRPLSVLILIVALAAIPALAAQGPTPARAPVPTAADGSSGWHG